MYEKALRNCDYLISVMWRMMVGRVGGGEDVHFREGLVKIFPFSNLLLFLSVAKHG